MIPLRDLNPSRTKPYVTWALIAINVAVFIVEFMLDGLGQLDALLYNLGLVPSVFLAQPLSIHLATLFTSMFLHGSWVHVLGNMLYLWIFGDNIEDEMGHGRFLLFYLIGGLVAAATQIIVSPTSTVPIVGASGAIAAVLGAYLIEFPRARIRSLLFLGYFIRFVNIPAVFVLGFWFLLQFFNGFLSLGAAASEGGVAYFAHIGGFVAGVALVKLFASGRPRSDFPVWRG